MPTPEEIREILDVSDIRGKPLTLLLVSSGIREGAVETLHVGHYVPIRSIEMILFLFLYRRFRTRCREQSNTCVWIKDMIIQKYRNY